MKLLLQSGKSEIWPSRSAIASPIQLWKDGSFTLYVASQLENLPEGAARATIGPLAPNRLVVSLVEGWRGEIAHVVSTDPAGRFEHYKVKDPSFHDWFGLAMALRDGQISDFPLCNKSFNLSYAGHDL